MVVKSDIMCSLREGVDQRDLMLSDLEKAGRRRGRRGRPCNLSEMMDDE